MEHCPREKKKARRFHIARQFLTVDVIGRYYFDVTLTQTIMLVHLLCDKKRQSPPLPMKKVERIREQFTFFAHAP